MHAKVYQEILDGDIQFLLEHMIQMGAGNSDIVGDVGYADVLHVHFVNIVNCKIYIGIVAVARLTRIAFGGGISGMEIREDGEKLKENGFPVEIIGKAQGLVL